MNVFSLKESLQLRKKSFTERDKMDYSTNNTKYWHKTKEAITIKPHHQKIPIYDKTPRRSRNNYHAKRNHSTDPPIKKTVFHNKITMNNTHIQTKGAPYGPPDTPTLHNNNKTCTPVIHPKQRTSSTKRIVSPPCIKLSSTQIPHTSYSDFDKAKQLSSCYHPLHFRCPIP